MMITLEAGGKRGDIAARLLFERDARLRRADGTQKLVRPVVVVVGRA